MRKKFDPKAEIGKTFYRWTIIAIDEEESKRRSAKGPRKKWCFICQCTCGTIRTVEYWMMRNGHSKSCGCYQKERAIEWGESRDTPRISQTRLGGIWYGIRRRCYDETAKCYKNYGGRGITMCDEWKNNMEAFYTWAMNNGYKEGLSIDRIDNDKGYSPENCRWTNQPAQTRNTRSNVYLTYTEDFTTIGYGKLYHTYILSDWARILNIPIKFINHQYERWDKSGSVNDFLERCQLKYFKNSIFLGFVIPESIKRYECSDKYDQSYHD